MLVSVSFCWLILTAPLNLNTVLALNGVRTSSRDVDFLLKTICFCLLYINHSINLLLYCFTGRKFRLELKVRFLAANVDYFSLLQMTMMMMVMMMIRYDTIRYNTEIALKN